MADVVTETDIRKFEGMSRAVFPVGTILTPAAKDWAFEHHVAIAFESGNNPGIASAEGGGKEKDAFLRQVVKSVVHKVNQKGTPLSEDALATIVAACLERMGCQVK